MPGLIKTLLVLFNFLNFRGAQTPLNIKKASNDSIQVNLNLLIDLYHTPLRLFVNVLLISIELMLLRVTFLAVER